MAVIFSSSLYRFPERPEDFFDGKVLRVRGEVIEYEGDAEIILEALAQVEVGG